VVEAHESPEVEEDISESRRAFLAYVSALLSLLIALLLAVPLLGFVFARVFRRRTRRWVKLGAADDVVVGVPTKLVYSYPAREGGISTLVQGAVYAVTDDGRTYGVLSNTCSHAKCAVQWDQEREVFQCPCHEGRFSRTGKVISGPPPTPFSSSHTRSMRLGTCTSSLVGSDACFTSSARWAAGSRTRRASSRCSTAS